MKAWLVINEYLRTKRFKTLDEFLEQAAKKLGLEITVFYNSELPIYYGILPEDYFSMFGLSVPDFVLFWDKDVRLAAWLMSLGLSVYNSAESIALCDDKSATHQRLSVAGIPMPKTIVAPFTYENIGYSNYNFLKTVKEQLGFPMIIKECFGSFGAQVYFAKGEEELLEIVENIGTKPMIFQKLVGSSIGRDLRLEVVGDRVIAGICRFSKQGDFRANVSNGGSAKAYQVKEREERLAVRCCRLLGLTFGGVDLLFGEDGDFLVCEVNSNAHFKAMFECTGVNVAEEILKYLMENNC